MDKGPKWPKTVVIVIVWRLTENQPYCKVQVVISVKSWSFTPQITGVRKTEDTLPWLTVHNQLYTVYAWFMYSLHVCVFSLNLGMENTVRQKNLPRMVINKFSGRFSYTKIVDSCILFCLDNFKERNTHL